MQNIIKPQKNKERAFTVLELLVVIAIIGLLSMITLMSLSSATFRGRDTKTIYQLSQIPSKLAIEYASEGSYDNICLDEDNFSINSGLRDIQLELLSRGKTIKCFANGDNYCISSQLNSGEYYLVKNDLRFTDEEGCTSATIGGGLGEGNEVHIAWTCGDVLLDERDSKEYETVEIGTQCWMAENLNVGTMITSCTNGYSGACATGGDTVQNQGTSLVSIQKYCYLDSEANCTTSGGLYQWNQIMGGSTTERVRGICPEG